VLHLVLPDEFRQALRAQRQLDDGFVDEHLRRGDLGARHSIQYTRRVAEIRAVGPSTGKRVELLNAETQRAQRGTEERAHPCPTSRDFLCESRSGRRVAAMSVATPQVAPRWQSPKNPARCAAFSNLALSSVSSASLC